MAGGVQIEGEWRESAAFDVTVADYRAAFALAAASDRTPPEPYRHALRRTLGPNLFLGGLIGVLAGIALISQESSADPMDSGAMAALGNAIWGAGIGMALVVPVVLLLAAFGHWDARRWRRRFPRQQAEWKRPRRLRVRWGDTGLMVAGSEGFGSVAWPMLYGWLEGRGVLVIFTDMLEPVPIPHAALAPGDLDDLRARLAGAGIPPGWSLQAEETRALRRVFR